METTDLREIMCLSLRFVKKNGYSIAEALKTAWLNFKLRTKMQAGISKFYCKKKVSGEIREAFGTLRPDLLPETQGADRKPNPTIQVYFDTERGEYRCFKVANLVKLA